MRERLGLNSTWPDCLKLERFRGRYEKLSYTRSANGLKKGFCRALPGVLLGENRVFDPFSPIIAQQEPFQNPSRSLRNICFSRLMSLKGNELIDLLIGKPDGVFFKKIPVFV